MKRESILPGLKVNRRYLSRMSRCCPTFLTLFGNQDYDRAQKIHNETKGSLTPTAVPLQLSRQVPRGEAAQRRPHRQRKHRGGDLHRQLRASAKRRFFFFQLANFYANVEAHEVQPLLQAKDSFAAAQQLVLSDATQAISAFEKSRDLFNARHNTCEADIAESWAAQLLPDVAKVAESRRRLGALIAECRGTGNS